MAAINFSNYRTRQGLNVPLLIFLFPLLLVSNTALSQDTIFKKKKLRESEVQAIFSYYTQDGQHSAVTGGTGTEFLQVYSVNINYSQTVDGKRTYYLHVGSDLVSSASTDRIDFEISSASREDLHNTVSLGYSQKWKERHEVGGNVLFSLESDYASVGGELWWNMTSKDQTSAYHASVQGFFDDLRWGRLKKPYIVEAIRLIYPAELRYQEWFDIHNRYSYNFSFGYRKDLNQRMSLSLYPTYSYQEGLLSTPFHRVYFTNNDLRVENLPRKRNQAALGVQLNTFIQSRTILRSFYQYYTDDFGLSSHLIKLELPVKISPKLNLGPHLRYSRQFASRYFQPFGRHSPTAEFYTSDYDLSGFWSVNAGVNFSLKRFTENSFRWRLGSWSFRYSYYYRSDGLNANIFSAYFGLGKLSEKPKTPNHPK